MKLQESWVHQKSTFDPPAGVAILKPLTTPTLQRKAFSSRYRAYLDTIPNLWFTDGLYVWKWGSRWHEPWEEWEKKYSYMWYDECLGRGKREV